MKGRLVSIIVCAALLILISACSNNDKLVDPAGGFVQGTIVEFGTNNVLDSVQVFLLSKNLVSTGWNDKTDAEGNYLIFSGFDVGEMYIRASKEGYLQTTRKVTVVRADTITLNIDLQKR